MYKETAYENLGFPDNMTYEQRSELRKECSKFIKFSYLVDFIALNSLKNIYQFSVQELLTELE
jgi:dynein heavy chain